MKLTDATDARVFIKNLKSVAYLAAALLFWKASLSNGFCQSFGPYTITGTLPNPTGGTSAITFYDGYLYSLEANFPNVHQIDPVTGQVLQSWTANLGGSYPLQLPEGLCSYGGNLWLATGGTAANDEIFQITLQTPPAVAINSSFTVANEPYDLTYANGDLFCPEYPGEIAVINPTTGALIRSLNAPSRYIYGITFDGQNLLAGYGPAGTGSGVIWVLSPTNGSVLSVWNTDVPDITGLAYNQASETLYIATGDSGIYVAQIIPEPQAAALLTLAISLLGLRCRRGIAPKSAGTSSSADQRDRHNQGVGSPVASFSTLWFVA